ncbi:ubiquitin carboxyl-terminal hydrolase 8-like [Branchiostoma floridae]|uniref:ubiquitinyl hydrolase 1 n=1 Tax=Branchiostoma floridae TaxID=7739 RepID=A0A9J7KR67_BRAFL|nr:ubiquitin carboxyl-terminal hydrolase 8-like [Branchiostoma floridae]
MPSASKKNLYLSSSVGGLNKLAEVKLERGISLKSYCNSATKLYKAALEHSLLGDEEKAYVLYMKYFNIYGHIRKSKDFKKDESYYAKLMGSANAKKAIEEAEKLSKSLNDRYDLKADAEKAKKVAEELEVLRDSSGKDDKVTLSPSDDVGSFFPYVPVDKLSSSGVYNLLKVGEKKTPLSPEKPNEPDEITKALEKSVSVIRETKPGFISAEQLYNMFQDRDTSFLIMDVRPQDQYSSSHIKHGASINIPAEVIKPGTTVSVIERGLPEDTRTQWDRRGQVDHIILVDWEGGAEDLAVGSTLQSLKDAMFKWDSVTIIKSEPLVLEGGFDNWLFTYPMYTTNPSVPRPPAYTQQEQHGIISFDFDYPTLDDEKEEEPEVQDQKKDERASPVGVIEPPPALTANQNGSAVGLVSVPASQVDVVQQPKDVPKPSPPVVNRATKPLVKVPPSSPKHQKPTPTVNGTAGQGATDDSLVEGSKPSQPAPTQPSFPQVDRSTKPKISLNRTSELDKPSGPSEAELRISELAKIGLEKLEAERRKIEEERQRIEEEKKKLEVERLNHMRNMQEKEDEKKQELERIEEEKRARDRQLEKLRKQKQEKLKQQQEAEEKREEELEKERQKQERERQLKEEEEKKLQELEDTKKREAEKKAQQEREEAERAQKLKEEQEKLSREKAETARQEEIARAEKEREERLRQETAKREREEQERQERIKKQQERDKEFARLEADKSSAGSKNPVTSPGLPVGWEKVLDQQTGRYYYKDHNTATTHWNLPQSILNRSPGSGSGTYKVSLQDEPQGKGKLRRSHSSPNIAQMVADELAETKKVPKVDRKGKPEIVRAPKVRPESAEVQAARLRNMQPVFGGQGRGLTGLRNLGNTCYMNSIIQSLCSATLLSEYFLKETYKFDINRENKLGCNGEIAEEFAAIIKALWSGQYRSVAPRDFKCSVGKYNSQFANFNQQDSQEFLLFLMDGLHEDMNRVKNREYIQDEDMSHLPDVTLAERAWQNHKRLNQSIIVELFQGQFKSTLECLRCKKTSTTFEAFMYLSLPIPSSGRCKLQDCVQTFTKPEKVSGSDKWYCSRCKTHREAVKKIEIWKLPPFLLIHLKRFKYEGVWRQKLNTNVDFPLSSFDMRPFIVGPKPQPHYKLFAVSNHYGTMEGGHYTAFCKNTGNRKWYKFDDHEVNELSTSSVQSSAAYILFYSAMELQPPNQTSF